MNPLSSVPPTPQGADPSSPPKESVVPSQNSVKEVATSSSSPQIDVVSLSPPTQEASDYLKQMSQIPDVRIEKIMAIQKAIDSNSYDISPENLADKLLQDLHSQPQEPRPPTTS